MKNRYGIATCNFSTTDDLLKEAVVNKVPCSFLPLIAGDRVCVIAEQDGWCYGSRNGDTEECGLFPYDVVKFLADRQSQQSDILSAGDGIVEEIERMGQQWWLKIKDIYRCQTDVHYLDEVLSALDEMLCIRTTILAGGVPEEELSKLRQQVAKKIDRGNFLLSLPVIIRDENGRPYAADAPVSILQMYQKHIDTERCTTYEYKDEPAKTEVFSLMVTVQSVKLKTKYNCEVSMILYDVTKKKFISDTFSFIWKSTDPQAHKKNVRALFANLHRTPSDVARQVVLITRISQISPIEGSSSTLKKVVDTGPESQYCRQLHAFDFYDVSPVFDNPQPTNDAKEKVILLNREHEFEQSFKSLQVTGRIPKFDTSDNETKMLISTQVLAGNITLIRRNEPHLFSRNAPKVRMPTLAVFDDCVEQRNSLFMTLQHGELSGKSSDKNIEGRLSVVESNGRLVQDCFEFVNHSGERHPTSDYRSFVFYHNDKPFWMEQIKILLPEEISHDLHLRITFHSRKPYDKGKPEKGPFALSHICLLQNASLINDTEHELLVYKIESTHFDPTNTSYLALPQTRKQLRELGTTNNKPHSSVLSLSEKSVVFFSTKAYSSILTQNEHILNVLRWRTNSFNLTSSLQHLATPVGETENDLMHFMTPLFNALFDIWDERDQLELPVFDLIVVLMKLCEEGRFVGKLDEFNSYMEKFPFTSASVKLIRNLNHYIASAATTNNEKTRNSLKVMGKVFTAIVASKKCGERFFRENSAAYLTEFRGYLDSILEQMIGLMSENRERMAVQNTALKHLPSIIDPILRSNSVDVNELCNFVMRLMRGFGKNIVARERLGFVSQLIETELFQNGNSRCLLLPRCLDLLLVHLDVDTTSTIDKDYADRSSECVLIISNLIEKLFPNNPSEVLGSDEELALIISSMYRPLVRAMVVVQSSYGYNEAMRTKFFALLLMLLSKMSAQIFDQLLKNCLTLIDKLDFTVEMIQMIRDLLSKCPFNTTWQQMILEQNKVVSKALRFTMSTMQNYFSNENFHSEVWEEYMQTVVCFVTQESLQLDSKWQTNESDGRILLRKASTKELRSMWYRLTPVQKMEYIPRLVGSFLKVALIEDSETRCKIIPIFFDMMQCEFHSYNPDQETKKNFKLFSDELIFQLDSLVNRKYGSPAFKDDFTKILTGQCQSDKDCWNGGGRELILRVESLLGSLFEYRQAREKNDCIENAMSRTVQLLRFYENYDHRELYVSYIYRLYEMHILCSNQIEAANTLMLHAKMLSWNSTLLPDWMIDEGLNRGCDTERQLKDCILSECANLLAEGQLWEDAIAILRDLVPVYEKEYVDYDGLASLYTRIADLYKKISTDNRLNFFYYLVGFYGKGFPAYLNEQRFVFRSDQLERINDFNTRMQQMYGNCQILPTMDDFSHLASSPGRHLQVFSIHPIAKDSPLKHRECANNINPSILEYYRHYNISDFEYGRPETRKESKWTEIEDSEVMRTWLVKRRLVTHESLPGILRCSKVMSCSPPIEVTPLRKAVDDMETKNRKMWEISQLALLRNDSNMAKTLSQEINGVVTALVQGGIKNYEVFFGEAITKVYTSEDRQYALTLNALIIEQVEILEYCLYVHASRPDCDGSIHELLIDRFREHKNYIEDRFGRTRSILPHGASIHKVQASVAENGAKDRKSNGNIMDDDELSGAFSPGLKSRGVSLGSTMLSMLSPARKSNQPIQSPSITSQRSTSSISDFYRSQNSFSRLDSRDSMATLQSPSSVAGTLRRTTNDGTIRLRPSITRESCVPPPLPPRKSEPREGGNNLTNHHLDRSALLGEKHGKPPVPTPIMD